MGRKKSVIEKKPKKTNVDQCKFCTTSTQTEEPSELFNINLPPPPAYVVVERLENVLPEILETSKRHSPRRITFKNNIQVVKFKSGEKSGIDSITKETGNDETQEISSMVGPIKDGPSGLSKLPRNYNIFVQPITNNERANSTLQDISMEQDKNSSPLVPNPLGVGRRKSSLISTTIKSPVVQRTSTDKRKYQCRSKPGPKCFKERLMQLQDLRIPAMMDDGVNNIERPMVTSLSTVFEHSLEHENTPNLSLNLSALDFNEMTFDLIMKDIAIQTEDNEVVPRENSSGQAPANANVNENNSRNTSARPNIRLQFENFTTLITSRSQRKNEDASSTSSLNDETQPGPTNSEFNKKKEKYIKITANTVHIHNHFYNN